MNLFQTHEYAHPDYTANIADWAKYRLVLDGGRAFVNKYLKKYSQREDNIDFNDRREMTYCPGHAEASLIDIRNTIYQRMQDIVRITDVESFNASANGDYRGVDNGGSSMNGFMGRTVLTELLFLSRVGIFVDRRPEAILARTKSERLEMHPYMYIVQSEDIINWEYNNDRQLISLLLAYDEKEYYNKFHLVKDTVKKYKMFTLTNDGVEVILFDKNMEQETDPIVLHLSRIPFVMIETSRPLLKNIADYQIALLNMESSDVSYAIRSNFTFYTEQYDPKASNFSRMASLEDENNDSSAVDSQTQSDLTNKSGHMVGRRYPIGTDRPEFIAPPADPLRVSMEKEDNIKSDVRKLVNLNLSLLEPVRASAESKKMDARGLESGLSSIGMDLEQGERESILIWGEYDGIKSSKVTIQYPSNYNPKSDGERVAEAKDYLDLAEKSTSETYKREMSKHAVRVLLSNKIDEALINKIYEEIEKRPAVIAGIRDIVESHREGLVSDALASELLGYPAGDAKQAAKDHAERAARVVTAQQAASQTVRGVKDLDTDPDSDRVQKDKQTDLSFNTDPGVRGQGQ